MARLTESYLDDLHERLGDPNEALGYLAAAIEEGDVPTFLLALRDVVEARGIQKVAKATGLNRENLYRILSEQGNPRLSSLSAILDAMGLLVSFSQAVDRAAERVSTPAPGLRQSVNLKVSCPRVAAETKYYVSKIKGDVPIAGLANDETKFEPLAA